MSELTAQQWLSLLANIRGQEPEEALNSLRNFLRRQVPSGVALMGIAELIRNLQRSANLPLLRVSVVSDLTIQPLSAAIRVAALRLGRKTEILEGSFANYRQDIFSSDSAFNSVAADVRILGLSTWIFKDCLHNSMSSEDALLQLDLQVAEFRQMWSYLLEISPTPIIQHTFPPLPLMPMGPAERGLEYNHNSFTRTLNEKLRLEAPRGVFWLDVDWIAQSFGLRSWYDWRLFDYAKYPFSISSLPAYEAALSATFREILGERPKVIVVDLDNTLWGGILGDDGPDGVEVGPETVSGQGFQRFGEYLKLLSQRGILLAICSKNDLARVEEVFRNNRHLPIGIDDFAVVRCNWRDKAQNLLEIADELKVHASSLVFVDDNGAECERVRSALPDVTVVELGENSFEFVQRLESTSLFHTQSLTQSDLMRGQSIKSQLALSKSGQVHQTLDDFHRDLEMVTNVQLASVNDVERLAQMESRTNQFNLATRRRSAADLERLINDKHTRVVTFSLSDRLADHGTVAYATLVKDDETLVITDWILSCRAFERTLEACMVAEFSRFARALECNTLVCEFVPTARNGRMPSILESLGFKPFSRQAESSWSRKLVPDSSTGCLIRMRRRISE